MDQPGQFDREVRGEHGENEAADPNVVPDDQRTDSDSGGSDEEASTEGEEGNGWEYLDEMTDQERRQRIDSILGDATLSPEIRDRMLQELMPCNVSVSHMEQVQGFHRFLSNRSSFAADQINPQDAQREAPSANPEQLQLWTRIVSQYETLPTEASQILGMIPCVVQPGYDAALAEIRRDLEAAEDLANLRYRPEDIVREDPSNVLRDAAVPARSQQGSVHFQAGHGDTCEGHAKAASNCHREYHRAASIGENQVAHPLSYAQGSHLRVDQNCAKGPCGCSHTASAGMKADPTGGKRPVPEQPCLKRSLESPPESSHAPLQVKRQATNSTNKAAATALGTWCQQPLAKISDHSSPGRLRSAAAARGEVHEPPTAETPSRGYAGFLPPPQAAVQSLSLVTPDTAKKTAATTNHSFQPPLSFIESPHLEEPPTPNPKSRFKLAPCSEDQPKPHGAEMGEQSDEDSNS
jgi:hypothetical protein